MEGLPWETLARPVLGVAETVSESRRLFITSICESFDVYLLIPVCGLVEYLVFLWE